MGDSRNFIIERVQTETNQAKTFFIKPMEGQQPDYKPGQFVHLALPAKNNTEYRSYSFSSIPEEGMAFTVKAMENGNISRLFYDHYKEGNELNVINIAGKFVLPDDLSDIHQVFFFAAGSGITPIFALIKSLLLHQPHIHIFLAYSNSSPQQTIFYHTLQELQQQFPERLEIEFIFSNNKNLLKARLSGFWLQELIARHKKADWPHILAYTCGPIEYMDTVKITLFTEGMVPTQFFMEYFETMSEEMIIAPEDKEAHMVHIHFKDTDTTVTVQYPDSILDAGLNAGLQLPHSCRSGQCGTCAARIVKGEVWIQYNEVLTHKDLENGLTLTCMGFPINGDVTITYD
jgi:ring-1,2-phenylacetyl-CoA epoxidase subunit PaaE